MQNNLSQLNTAGLPSLNSDTMIGLGCILIGIAMIFDTVMKNDYELDIISGDKEIHLHKPQTKVAGNIS